MAGRPRCGPESYGRKRLTNFVLLIDRFSDIFLFPFFQFLFNVIFSFNILAMDG
jgi:hypothetical protein